MKDKCKRGHELSGENIYVTPSTGARVCRKCQALNKKIKRHKLGISKAFNYDPIRIEQVVSAAVQVYDALKAAGELTPGLTIAFKAFEAFLGRSEASL